MDVGMAGQSMAPRLALTTGPAGTVRAAIRPEAVAAPVETVAAEAAKSGAGSGDLGQRVAQAIDRAHSMGMGGRDNKVRFELDSKSGNVVVKVVDRLTSEVIREIPAEEILEMKEKLEELRGVLFDSRG